VPNVSGLEITAFSSYLLVTSLVVKIAVHAKGNGRVSYVDHSIYKLIITLIRPYNQNLFYWCIEFYQRCKFPLQM